MARNETHLTAQQPADSDDDLEHIIAARDREISGLYLVLSEMGVSQDVAWTRAAELLEDRAQHADQD
ncbi:hypothetical protein [Mycobacteroides abscessus]|uniref:hypothetical protein n=1 Tax=Mycobacteroides abscessus TaxID=36809 RepID=UPI0009A6DDE1|nr:hypothetical protein [Mycobacteroides abscessus]SLC86534.1 Uncharacterised protein [Mycobacteroides abscessus subsp. abscessus]SLG74814.1 Uncharacterised protein [Mycobacteroides abscessus subsp. abscessus]